MFCNEREVGFALKEGISIDAHGKQKSDAGMTQWIGGSSRKIDCRRYQLNNFGVPLE